MTVEHAAKHFQFFLHDRHSLTRIDTGIFPVAVGILTQSLFEAIQNADIVDDKPPGLSLKTRFTRAIACMRVWPFIGLSI